MTSMTLRQLTRDDHALHPIYTEVVVDSMCMSTNDREERNSVERLRDILNNAKRKVAAKGAVAMWVNVEHEQDTESSFGSYSIEVLCLRLETKAEFKKRMNTLLNFWKRHQADLEMKAKAFSNGGATDKIRSIEDAIKNK